MKLTMVAFSAALATAGVVGLSQAVWAQTVTTGTIIIPPGTSGATSPTSVDASKSGQAGASMDDSQLKSGQSASGHEPEQETEHGASGSGSSGHDMGEDHSQNGGSSGDSHSGDSHGGDSHGGDAHGGDSHGGDSHGGGSHGGDD